MPIEIHGKQYKTVAERVAEFEAKCQTETREPMYHTEVIHHDGERVIMKAMVGYRDSEGNVHWLGSGHGEEKREGQINRTSALENAETSAVGRALAFAGFAGTEIASADELAQALAQQKFDDQRLSDYAKQKIKDDPGGYILPVGKYKGETVEWVAQNDASFAQYCYDGRHKNEEMCQAFQAYHEQQGGAD